MPWQQRSCTAGVEYLQGDIQGDIRTLPVPTPQARRLPLSAPKEHQASQRGRCTLTRLENRPGRAKNCLRCTAPPRSCAGVTASALAFVWCTTEWIHYDPRANKTPRVSE